MTIFPVPIYGAMFWILFSFATVQALVAMMQMENRGMGYEGFKTAARSAMCFLAAIAIGVYQ